MESGEVQYGDVNGLWDKVRNVFRISYTLNFVFAALVGVAFAWTVVPEWTIGTLIVLDVFFLALFVNISNDYFDHKSGADENRWKKYSVANDKDLREMFNEKIYWSGNAFDRGIVSDRTGKVIIASLAVIAVLLAIPILLFGGWMVLLMGGVAFFLSYFYTAPPLNLGARGLGEVDVLLSFTFLSLFPYVVLVNDINLEMFLISITVGLCVMLLRSVDQMSGYEAHKAAGEKDFSVRFGLDGSGQHSHLFPDDNVRDRHLPGPPLRGRLRPSIADDPGHEGAHQDIQGQGRQIQMDTSRPDDVEDRDGPDAAARDLAPAHAIRFGALVAPLLINRRRTRSASTSA